jgi:hypothetical protein
MTVAIVTGAVVWSVIAGVVVVWLAALALGRGALVGPRRVARWLLGSWLSRGLIIAAWAAAGWHVFCQRP